MANNVVLIDLGDPVPALQSGDVGVTTGTLWAPCVVCARLTCLDENDVDDEEWERLTGWPSWRHRWWPVDREQAAHMLRVDEVLCSRCIAEFRAQAAEDESAGRPYRPEAAAERARRAAAGRP